MIKQLFLGILLGFCCILFFAQFDPWVHERVGQATIRILSKTFRCQVSGTVVSMSIFPPSLTIKNLSFSSPNKKISDWSWSAATYVTGFSWRHLFFEQAIDMWIQMEHVQAYSGIADGRIAIFPHVIDLIKGPNLPIPLFLKSVQMRRATVLIDNGMQNRFYWNGESHRVDGQLRSQFYVYDGSVTKDQTVYVQHVTGMINLDVKEQNNKMFTSIQVDGRGEAPQLDTYPICFFTGRWLHDRGRFEIHNADYSLHINPLIIVERDNRFSMDSSMMIPMPYISKVLISLDPKIRGMARVQLRGDLYAQGNGEGHLICEDVTHHLITPHAILRSSFVKHGLQVEGTWNVRSGMQYASNGTFFWDGDKEHTECKGTNSLPLIVPWQSLWKVNTRDLQVHLTYDKQDNELIGTIACNAFNTANNTPIPISGRGMLDSDQRITGEAVIGDYECVLNAWNDDEPRIDYLGLFDKQKKSLALCKYDSNKHYHTGFVDIALLRLLGDMLLHYDVHSKGMLLFKAGLKDHCIRADIQLQDATVRLPQTLNFMQDCTASCEIDLLNRKLTMKDVHGALHTGQFYIPKAVVWLDKEGELQFAHIPLIIDHCLFTIKHDLFAMISGSLLLQKQYNSDALLTGHIILDRSQCKENLFSASVQKKLLQSSEFTRMYPLPLQCDLTIETKEPIRIDTSFLEANAQLFLHVQHNIAQPTISGTICVPSGSIQFPYKPLHLIKGDITFLPEQPFNPLIEIVAKNTIKNHHVSLHVSGSLQDHLVMLESTPPLTEEQIVGLLLAGAHEESLQALIPSLLMQNVTNYIFSSHKSNFYDRYIKPWMKQINVHLMPNFNEQSGRGGLRGALEITVNDRWRALIEKNFTLTEDTRFELEYTLSDDVTFRLVRDERCDIGAEVEMRWKF